MDLCVPYFPVIDMARDVCVSLIVDLSLLVVDLVWELPYVVDMDFMFEDIVVGGCDQLQRLLVKYYVHFILGSEHVDWVVEIHLILMFECIKHRWLMYIFFLYSLMDWNSLVKIKMIVDISLGINV